jgi:hypothetical protein
VYLRFPQLAIDAVARIAAGREGFGVSLDGAQGPAAFGQAASGAISWPGFPHRMENATPSSFKRRWITLISAGRLPHCIGPSRGCLVLKSGIIP